jgi:hypothetical protein
MQYLADPTLLMGSDVSTNYVFSISSSVLSEQGDILGEIMKVGYTFACFMTKKTVFSQVIQLPTYKSIFFI